MQSHYKIPAHQELNPSDTKWIEVDAESSRLIQKETEIVGKVCRIGSSIDGLEGYYSIQSSSNKYFIKILSDKYLAQQLAAEKLTQWLSTENVTVNQLLEGFPKKIRHSRHFILAYFYIDGRFLKPNQDEMYLAGQNIGLLHNVLKKCPWSEIIISNTANKSAQLIQKLNKCKSGIDVDEIPETVLKILLSVEPDVLEILSKSPQIIHGDLNFGNILLRENDSKLVFLDFEDSSTGWHSPLLDVAFFIERFILTLPNDTAIKMASVFLSSYISVTNNNFTGCEHLPTILQALSIRALLILSLNAEKNAELIPMSEWEKFISLYIQTKSKSQLLKNIYTASNASN
jgi:Ser/Thr protein kinase RdoA (MazF antagonist)